MANNLEQDYRELISAAHALLCDLANEGEPGCDIPGCFDRLRNLVDAYYDEEADKINRANGVRLPYRQVDELVSYDTATVQERTAVVDELTAEAERLVMYSYGSKRLAELEVIASAARPPEWSEYRSWRDEYGYNNGGCSTRFFYIPEHNGGAKVEMLAEVSEHIVTFQPSMATKLLACIRAADDMRSWYDKQMGPDGPEIAYDTARVALEQG